MVFLRGQSLQICLEWARAVKLAPANSRPCEWILLCYFLVWPDTQTTRNADDRCGERGLDRSNEMLKKRKSLHIPGVQKCTEMFSLFALIDDDKSSSHLFLRRMNDSALFLSLSLLILYICLRCPVGANFFLHYFSIFTCWLCSWFRKSKYLQGWNTQLSEEKSFCVKKYFQLPQGSLAVKAVILNISGKCHDLVSVPLNQRVKASSQNHKDV